MVYTMNKPPKNFEDLVLGHFHSRVHDILLACKAYIEGQQEVRYLVSDNSHTPSIKFKKDLISCINPLVKAFDGIGAKEAQQYLYLTEEKTAFPANVLTPVLNEGINDASNKKRKATEEINPAAKKERKVADGEGTSDPTKKEGKGDEDITHAVNVMKKVAEEIIVGVREKNKVTVDERTDDDSSTKKESKVVDTDVYPLCGRFTIRASFDSVISKVLVHAGMPVKKGQPLYVTDPTKTQNHLLDLPSHAPVEESKAKYSMIQKILLTANRSLGVGIFSMEDVLVDQKNKDADLKNSLMTRGLGNEGDDALQRYENFKQFDCVEDIPDHFFSAQKSNVNQEWVNKIREEWAILEKGLPETIFVRVDESRMDLLRAVIIGPQGTPYCDGLFFFDVCFPSNYPITPPLVHYHSGGYFINPNLYKCGKVVLSLPKETGGQETMWVPGTSTILELLVSIQNQVLTKNPIYNDLTYVIMRGALYGRLFSACYNGNTIVRSVKTIMHVMNKPPQKFEDFVAGHFSNRLHNVMATCNMMARSTMFKDDMALCKKLIVDAISKTGAKDHASWANVDGHPLGTIFAVSSCTVVEVLVNDDIIVKKGDPLFVLYRPLPPPPTTPPSPFAPIPEFLKANIKESLEKKQEHLSPTIVDNSPTMQTCIPRDNVNAARLLDNFNKFDTVFDFSDHLFSAESSPVTEQHQPIEWVNQINQDRRLLMEHLPDSIFVRVYESRMDILRAAIIGQKGTPYHDGLFFFDVWFPRNYPHCPPLVRYYSGVPGISPHLNKFGDVRLVLFAEHGAQEHLWMPGTSNMLQLLVSIRDLILNAKPYFNIIGPVTPTISLMEERTALLFNENIVVKSLKTMVYTMNKPPKNFEDLVLGHFHTRVHGILMACKGYVEGQEEVGCLVSDNNHTPSIKFKKDLISCINPLVKAFDKIGAKEAQEYLYLTEMKTVFPANALTPVLNEGINDASNKKRKATEELNPVAKNERKVSVDEGTSEESSKEESKVLDTDIYPLCGRFTMRASFDSVISKVLVHAGMTVEKGQPLYVTDPTKTQNLLDISSHSPKAEYSMIQKILTANRSLGVGIFSMEDGLVDQDADLKNSLMARGLGNEDVDVLKRYENFKKFGYVKDIPDHFFSAQKADMNQPSKEWVNKIREEWAILEKELPETIFVRVDESRMDLLRAVIIGPQGTPYGEGLFFFDVCFPSNYPITPPLVHYHSGGYFINPNLYKCGKVVLSLPKTTGGQENMWVPGTSTILELLVSIQKRVLTKNPIYNDLTYAVTRGSVHGKLYSGCYNGNSIVKSVKTMVHVMNTPPMNFEDFVVGHFSNRLHKVIATCNMFAHSIMFKDDMVLCKKLIVDAVSKSGVKVPEEFLP